MTQTLAVLGANGRSGTLFIEQALALGYLIRAGVHGPANTLVQSERLVIMPTDATDAAAVETLLSGADIVVSFIGHVPGSPPRVQTDAMRVVTSIMQQRGIKRIISLTGTGVRFAGDRPSLIDRVLNYAVAIVDPQRIRDGIEHAEVLKNSQLDWTIVRVLKLTNAPPRRFSLTAGGPARLLTSRQDVATAILDIIEADSFTEQAPVVSRPTR